MELLCELEMRDRAYGWKLRKAGRRYALTSNAARFQENLRRKAKEILGIQNLKKHIESLSLTDEFVIVVHTHFHYDENFNRNNGNQIPDTDHVGTLVMNTMKGIIYEDDIQVCNLQLFRWRCEEGEESITIKIYRN